MNPIKFWEYICRVVVPIPGDIELRAGQWHFFHFGISFLITLFIGSVLWLITDSNIYYLIVAGVLFAVFIWCELRGFKSKSIIELRDALTDLNQYASCWLVPLWAYGHYTWAIAVFGVILAIYYLTIKWAKP